jgi:hypothetical protein
MDQQVAVFLRAQQGLEDTVDLGVDGMTHGGSVGRIGDGGNRAIPCGHRQSLSGITTRLERSRARIGAGPRTFAPGSADILSASRRRRFAVLPSMAKSFFSLRIQRRFAPSPTGCRRSSQARRGLVLDRAHASIKAPSQKAPLPVCRRRIRHRQGSQGKRAKGQSAKGGSRGRRDGRTDARRRGTPNGHCQRRNSRRRRGRPGRSPTGAQ